MEKDEESALVTFEAGIQALEGFDVEIQPRSVLDSASTSTKHAPPVDFTDDSHLFEPSRSSKKGFIDMNKVVHSGFAAHGKHEGVSVDNVEDDVKAYAKKLKYSVTKVFGAVGAVAGRVKEQAKKVYSDVLEEARAEAEDDYDSD
jgi:hypothetical protein